MIDGTSKSPLPLFLEAQASSSDSPLELSGEGGGEISFLGVQATPGASLTLQVGLLVKEGKN